VFCTFILHSDYYLGNELILVTSLKLFLEV
jgi:hypothetical protein